MTADIRHKLSPLSPLLTLILGALPVLLTWEKVTVVVPPFKLP